MKYILTVILGLTMLLSSCKDDDPSTPTLPTGGNETLYFPPVNSGEWETTTLESLNWNTDKIQPLYDLLDSASTRAFLVLKDGKIVLEHYHGKDLLGLTDFNKDKQWYWASAGKTLTAFLVGKAQEEGFLSINDKTSDYLGDWTSLTRDQEDKITVWHQLSMTSGLSDAGNSDCTDKECLTYKADPGTRWAYHNAPYTLLDSVVQKATNSDFDTYFYSKLRDPIGMDGSWSYLGYNHVYFSTPRSMARFGLLMLNEGKWENTTVLADQSYISDMISPSQDINESYGYLWWLNGKSSHMLPGLQLKINRSVAPNAPADMYSGLGKNGQFLCVVPSENLVVIRMGDNPDNSLVPAQFLDEMWGVLSEVIE